METPPNRLGYRMPAEWEEHEATWLSWPKDPDTFPPEILPQVEATFAKIALTLATGEEVRIMVNDDRTEQRVRGILHNTEGITFHHIRTVDVWVRDYGPTFLKGRERGLVRWRFNAWGNKYEELLPDDEAGDAIADESGGRVFRPGIVLEGGSIDVDGEGTVMTTEQCLLNPNRNPTIARKDIEYFLQKYLSVTQVLWLGSGIEGDDTDGHVDDLARFVDSRKVLVAREASAEDPNHVPLEAARGALKSAKDLSGRALEVIEVPMPPYLSTKEGRLPASHINFYIGNRAVLLPTFGGGSDREAMAVMQRALPSKEVVPIDCRALVYGLGTIHCVTQQVPRIR